MNGHIGAVGTKTHSAAGLEIITSIYECSECADCPLKEKCIRACGSKKPLEARHKVIYVSKRFANQREAMEAKISTQKGRFSHIFLLEMKKDQLGVLPNRSYHHIQRANYDFSPGIIAFTRYFSYFCPKNKKNHADIVSISA